MCFVILLFGPRAVLFFSFLFKWDRGSLAYGDSSMFMNVLGFLFIPFTMSIGLLLAPFSAADITFLWILGILEFLISLGLSLPTQRGYKYRS